MAPVSGVVHFDGEPLTEFDNAAVILTPQAGRLATGTIDPKDGTFTLSTYKPGDGAMVGPARLAVSATVDDPSARVEKHPGVRWVIPDDFSDRDRSGLTCEVVAGEDNHLLIQLHSDGTGTVETQR